MKQSNNQKKYQTFWRVFLWNFEIGAVHGFSIGFQRCRSVCKSCRSRQELSNEYLVFTCKIWLRYSLERASERVQTMYVCSIRPRWWYPSFHRRWATAMFLQWSNSPISLICEISTRRCSWTYFLCPSSHRTWASVMFCSEATVRSRWFVNDLLYYWYIFDGSAQNVLSTSKHEIPRILIMVAHSSKSIAHLHEALFHDKAEAQSRRRMEFLAGLHMSCKWMYFVWQTFSCRN